MASDNVLETSGTSVKGSVCVITVVEAEGGCLVGIARVSCAK